MNYKTWVWSDRGKTEKMMVNKRLEMEMDCITNKNDHVNCAL